eukprot:14314-Heterococcus_DN1.PRE.1
MLPVDLLDARDCNTAHTKLTSILHTNTQIFKISWKQFCTTWASRCLNVHPSLLPDFAGGMDMAVHEAVIAAKKEKSGCTIHFVTEVRLQQVFNKVMEGDLQHPEGFALRKLAVDGGPIVVQEEVAVTPEETAASLRVKVQAREGPAFLQAIRMFQKGEIGPNTSTAARKTGVSYKDAGVDIDAGNALVELCGPQHCSAYVHDTTLLRLPMLTTTKVYTVLPA